MDTPPSFPGGEPSLFEWLSKNIVYPPKAQTGNIQGKVILQFIVDETGKVIFPKIVRGVDPVLDAEAIRVANSMPDWTPGKQGDKAVNVRYTLPVLFKLSGNNKLEKQASQDIDIKTCQTQKVKVNVLAGNTPSNSDKNGVYDRVDNPPTFPGGGKAMYKFLGENILYPAKAMESKIQGVVKVNFLVDENGNIIDPKITQSIHPLLDNEALRIIKIMPKWKPATLKGKKVKSVSSLPITFKIQ